MPVRIRPILLPVHCVYPEPDPKCSILPRFRHRNRRSRYHRFTLCCPELPVDRFDYTDFKRNREGSFVSLVIYVTMLIVLKICEQNRSFFWEEIIQDSKFIVPINFFYCEFFLSHVAFWKAICYTVIHNSITVKTHGGCRNETDYFKCIWHSHIRTD